MKLTYEEIDESLIRDSTIVFYKLIVYEAHIFFLHPELNSADPREEEDCSRTEYTMPKLARAVVISTGSRVFVSSLSK